MISAAQSRHGRKLGPRYVVASDPPEVADYGVASGIFNVRLDGDKCRMAKYVEFTMDVLIGRVA